MEISEEFIDKQIDVLSSQLSILKRLKNSFSNNESKAPKKLTKKEREEIESKKFLAAFYKNKRT